VINDNSQGSIAARLGYGGLFTYDSERNFEISEHLAKLQAKEFIVSRALFALLYLVYVEGCRTHQMTYLYMTDRNYCCSCYIRQVNGVNWRDIM